MKNQELTKVFEKKFMRQLSSMELEIISSWIDEGYSEEMILNTLKEAVCNGEYNPRYIDRILYTWKKNNQNTNDMSDEPIVIESNLNPEFTFDNFILDANNKFAKETALRVVEQLGVIYNPLKIYGKNGSVKTHLLHAIGNYIENNSNKSVLYITSKTFVEHYNTMDYKLFRQKYSKVDVLIIDDFHLFIGNQDVQREFFNIFTYRVLENDMQTIISSIEPIGKLKNIEEYIIRKINAYGLEVEIKE